MNTSTVLDKILACDTDIVAHASAGTGKTYALVAKYLSELKKPTKDGHVRVDQLAAITFTDKAAAEMKQRVREALSKEIEILRLETHIKASSANLLEDDPEWTAKEKLLAHLIRQRQSLQSAYISTIHSFCARFLRENQVVAEVDPAFIVMEEGEAAALLSMTAQKVILNGLRTGNKEVERLTLCFGFESQGSHSPGLRDHITRLIPLIRAAHRTPLKLSERYANIAKTEHKLDFAALESLGITLGSMGTKANSKEKTVAAELGEVLRTRETSGKTETEIAIQLIKLSKELIAVIKKRKDDGGEDALRLADTMLNAGEAVIDREIAPEIITLCRLLDETIRQYSITKEKKSALDYDDLQEKALLLLAKNSDIRRMYSEKFHKIMVDEFQDTNQLQRDIVYHIARPGAGKLFIVGDHKQSIYGFRGADVAVFDQTAVDILGAKGEEFTLSDNRRSTPKLIEFTNGFFTQLMSGADGEARFDMAVDGLTAIRTGAGVDAAVQRMVIDAGEGKNIADQRQLEAVALADNIKRIVGAVKIEKDGESRPAGYGDIALLLRTFSSIGLYENAFRFARIPYRVVRGKGFHESMEIVDFANLLSCIDYTGDTLALASVLRSPLTGMSDAGLLRLMRDEDGAPRDPSRFVFDAVEPPDWLDPMDAERLRHFSRMVNQWREAKDRMTVSELIETILADSGYGAVMMSRFHGEQKLANLLKLIEKARVFEAVGEGGLKNFIAALKRKVAEESEEQQADITGGDSEAVRIMTVHQSKGLEFNIVILGDLASEAQKSSGRIMFHPEKGLAMQYYDARENQWFKGGVYRDIEETLNKSENEERKRLLYVGMTRARDRLSLYGPASKKNGTWSGWIDDALPAVGDIVETIVVTEPPQNNIRREDIAEPALARRILVEGYIPPVEKIVENQPKKQAGKLQSHVTALAAMDYCPRLYYYQNVMELPPSHKMTIETSEVKSEKLGSRIHEFLSKIPMGSGKPTVEYAASYLNNYFKDVDANTRDEIIDNLRNSFAQEPLRDISKTRSENIWRETPMLLKIAEPRLTVTITGSSDLLWHDGETWNLLDYKYATKPADESRYFFQIRLYAYMFMTSQNVDSVTASVVYLKEKRRPVSRMVVTGDDLPIIRERLVSIGARLLEFDGATETAWPVREGKSAKHCGCYFWDRCI